MSDNNTNMQKTTFWIFLKSKKIEIPIIQRDYAQGRLGKEYLRKSFLADLKIALDKALNNDIEPEMKLDFVYGSVENGKLSPLDGQQRLTTLWLLHWYIALMSGNLSEEVCKTLKNFTYETRISSREFCQILCKPELFKTFNEYKPTENRRIVDFITSRTWFYSAWKQDPTIQSMLRMLGGTEINDKNGEDIIDGLEEEFRNCKSDKLKEYWEKLISDDAPIIFYQLPLENFGLSDDLYIKMNARGKQLTSFENFKADLVGYIRENAKKESQEWNDLLDAQNGIPIRMDTTWTDIFWKNRSRNNNIDEIYFAFLNRFFLCELVCQEEEKEGRKDYKFTAEGLEKANSSFSYLYGENGDDSKTEYRGDLEKYKFYLQDNKEKSNIPKPLFIALSKVLDRCKETNLQEFFPDWAKKDSKFLFIPKYKKDVNTISTLTQLERVVFHAISKYLQNDNFDTTSFKQWMRVVWNIVENANINSIATMIGIMRVIDKLSVGAHNIYEHLKNLDIYYGAAEEQVNEEIAKAKKINEESSWESKIIEAENYKFFKGAIRFLFQNEKGKVTEESWRQFDTKWGNTQKYFDENGVKDCEDKKYRTEAILLKAVLYHVNDFWKYIEPQKFVLDNEAVTWKKNILLEQGWENAVHEVLMGKLDVLERNEDCLMYKNLYKTDLLNYVANEQVGSRIRWHHGHRTVYPPRYDGIMLDDEKRDKPFYRNSILSTLQNITSNQRIKGKPFFKGWDINFNYSKDGNSYDFQWNTDEHVYLIENNERKKKTDGAYYCVSVEGIDNVNAFEGKLNELICESAKQ